MIKSSVCVHMLVCNQRFKYFHISVAHVTCATIVNVSAFLTAYISAYKLKLDFHFSFKFAAAKLLILSKMKSISALENENMKSI